MEEKKVKDQYKTGPICGSGKQHILYAWAMDAPALRLPEGESLVESLGFRFNIIEFKIVTSCDAIYSHVTLGCL